MGDLSGTPRKVTLDGLTFDVAADTNVTINPPRAIEGMPTSGRAIFKHTKQIPMLESLPIVANSAEYESIRELNSRLEPFPQSITMADGSVYRATGMLNIEGYESEELRANVQLIPKTDWETFVA